MLFSEIFIFALLRLYCCAKFEFLIDFRTPLSWEEYYNKSGAIWILCIYSGIIFLLKEIATIYKNK